MKKSIFLKSLLTISIPLALQNLLNFCINMLDTVMLGRADDTGTLLSAASLANQPFFIMSMICFGLSGAGIVLSSQYWGKKDLVAIRHIFSIILKVAFLFSLLIGGFVLLAPEFVMSLYTDDPERILRGAEYLRVIGYSYFLFGLSCTTLFLLRSLEIIKISVVLNLVSLLLNGFFNYCLIFGNLGFPALGIRGAAYATLIARSVEFIVVCVYVFLIDKKLCFRPRHLLFFNKTLALDLVRHGLPVFLNETLWSLGVTIQASVIGHISYETGDPVAANSIASMVQQLCTVVIFGVANSAAVIIGKSIGANDYERTRRYAKYFQIVALALGLLSGALLLLLCEPIINFYSIPDATKELTRQMIRVLAVIVFFISFSALYIVGILRGAGDTRFCLLSELGCLWLVSVPLSLLVSAIFHWPAYLVLLFMKLDEPLKALICFLRVRGDRWIRNVTRDFGNKEAAEA